MFKSPSLRVVVVVLAYACCGATSPADAQSKSWTLPDWMLEAASPPGGPLASQAEAAKMWRDYFNLSSSNADPEFTKKIVDRLDEVLANSAPPDPLPPRPASSQNLKNTIDQGLKKPAANSTLPNRPVDLPNNTVDLGVKKPTAGGTLATGEVVEEVAESTLKRTAGAAGKVVSKVLPLVDLAIWAMDAYDGTTSFFAAQDAFTAEQQAEETSQELLLKQKLELYKRIAQDPAQFNAAYTPEELENLLEINLDQGQDPFAGLLAETPPEPPAPLPDVTPPAPIPATAATTTPPAVEDDFAQQLLALIAIADRQAQGESLPVDAPLEVPVLPEAPVVVDPPLVEPPLGGANPPVDLAGPGTLNSGSTGDNLDGLVAPSGMNNPNSYDVLQNFMNQLAHQSRSGHSSSAGSLSDSAAMSRSGESGLGSGSANSAATAAALQRLQNDPALRQRLQSAAQSAATSAGSRAQGSAGVTQALRNGNAGTAASGLANQATNRPARAPANAAAAGALGQRLPQAANGAGNTNLGNRLPQNTGNRNAPAVGNRLPNRPNVLPQGNARPAAGGFRGRASGRR